MSLTDENMDAHKVIQAKGMRTRMEIQRDWLQSVCCYRWAITTWYHVCPREEKRLSQGFAQGHSAAAMQGEL